MKIYVLFACDEWKSKGSMSMVTATTKVSKLKTILKEEIKQNNMELEWGEFKELDFSDIRDCNNRIKFGYIEELEDGKVL